MTILYVFQGDYRCESGVFKRVLALGRALGMRVAALIGEIPGDGGLEMDPSPQWIVCPEYFAAAPFAAQSAEILRERMGAFASGQGGLRMALGAHGPRLLQVFSILSAVLELPFVPNWKISRMPQMARSICANRFIETVEWPRVQPFFATLAPENDPLPVFSGDILPRFSPVLELDGILSRGILTPPVLKFEPFLQDGNRLEGARVVFSAGRGIGTCENFKRFVECAHLYHAAVGASRLAVDMGWARNDWQVGQTGKTVSPDIYVAFGISGAIQHLSGMKQSRMVIAVNTDKNAPIFEYADYGILADANETVAQLAALRVSSGGKA